MIAAVAGALWQVLEHMDVGGSMAKDGDSSRSMIVYIL